MKKLLLTLFFAASSLPGLARIVSVSDFGLKPDTGENAVPYVLRALKACRRDGSATLFFPKGRYDFRPCEELQRIYFESNTTDENPKRLAILIDRMADLTLDGGGSLFVMHDRIQPITVDDSRNIVLKNLTIDWDVPLTAQGEVVRTGDKWFDLRIDSASYPFATESGRLIFLGEGWRSPAGRLIEFQRGTNIIMHGDEATGRKWGGHRIFRLDRDTVRYYRDDGFERLPDTGNTIVIRHSRRDHAGIFVVESRNVRVENVTIHHTAGLGILCQYAEDVTFRNVRIVPDKTKGRVFSSHDDGFHIMGCKGLIRIDGCCWEGLMDDPVNIHGTYVRVERVIDDSTLLCRLMHPQSQGLRWAVAGDRAGVVDNRSMTMHGSIRIVGFVPLGKEVFLLKTVAGLPLGIRSGMALENLSWTPDVEIRNSFFLSSRARGLLVSTPGRVIVRDNYFASSGSAILIAGDANHWYESGAVRNILIQDNIFAHTCLSSGYQFTEAVISILPEIPAPDPQRPYHRNIRIVGNSFHPFDYPLLYARSVDGLLFSGNTVVRSYELTPWHPRKAGITLDACRNVRIAKNSVGEDVLGRTVTLRNMRSEELRFAADAGFRLAD